MQQFSIAILIGGRSSRMGKDKSFLPCRSGDDCFLEHLLNELSPLGPTYISTAAEKAEKLSRLKIPLLVDLRASCGPLGALETLLQQVETEWCFCCAVDMPNLSAELVSYLAEFCASDYDCVCLTVAGEQEPLCALYRKTALPVVQKQLAKQEMSLKKLLARLRTKKVAIEKSCFSKACVLNVNTPAEYRAYAKEPHIFCVSGVKNSGKTTLICGLLPCLRQAGYKVSVIKHDGHDFVMDYPGTDTARFTKAGAAQSIIYSGRQYAILGRVEDQEKTLQQLVQACQDSDFIIIEGLKNSAYPKLEVVRKAVSNTPVCPPETLLGLVTDMPTLQQSNIAAFALDDYEGVVAYVLRYFQGNKTTPSEE